jgi:hypothetical protein
MNDMPHLQEFQGFLGSLNRESDRGSVLISTAMLDDLLQRTIQEFLIEHPNTAKLTEGFNAPLGSFSARTLAAYAMGLISVREYEELSALRKIRNRFAHDIHISFDDQQIKDLCRNLTFKAHDYEGVTVSARGQFTSAATCLILNLTNRPHYVSKRRLAAEEWPY